MTTEQHAQGASVPGRDNLLGAPSPPQFQATNVGLPPPAYLQELRVAAERDEASFSQMFIADLLARDPRYGPEVGNEAKALIPRLLRAFENRYGNIIDSRYGYMCDRNRAHRERRLRGAAVAGRADREVVRVGQEAGQAHHRRLSHPSDSRSAGAVGNLCVSRTEQGPAAIGAVRARRRVSTQPPCE